MTRKNVTFALFTISVFLSFQVLSECLHYEPEVLELTGKIAVRTFPGPPNYEDVLKGDAPEICWILVLKKSRCVDANVADIMNIDESAVKEIQLVFSGHDDYEKYKDLLGKNVSVSGTLFHGYTGHHHTAVLMTVQNIR